VGRRRLLDIERNLIRKPVGVNPAPDDLQQSVA
jgi:hypothetical protein